MSAPPPTRTKPEEAREIDVDELIIAIRGFGITVKEANEAFQQLHAQQRKGGLGEWAEQLKEQGYGEDWADN